MKKQLQKLKKVKQYYSREIKLAIANNYEGVILPVTCDFELHGVYNCEDTEYIYEIAFESGWDNFVFIDFINKTEKFISLYELEAA